MKILKNRFLLLGISFTLLIIFWKMIGVVLPSKEPKHSKELLVAVAEVADVIERTVPYTTTAPGTFNTSQIINVDNRIDGEILEIHFKEGQIVNANDLLYTLDVKSFEAQLQQAEGVFEKDKALLENARTERIRNESMLRKNIISQSRFDQIKSTEQSLEAVLKSDQATIDLIKLQINYGLIRTPITGRIGFSAVNVGNVVKTSDPVPLTTVLKLDPIQFTFSLSEKYLSFLLNKDLSDFKISLLNDLDEERPIKGKLVAIDNSINPNTGSFQLKAHFENSQFELFSGQFANLKLTLEEKKNALVVPIGAVQTGPQGNYVFICNEPTNTVRLAPIKLGIITETWAVIEEGVKVADLVLISGQNRYKNGAKAQKLIKRSTLELVGTRTK